MRYRSRDQEKTHNKFKPAILISIKIVNDNLIIAERKSFVSTDSPDRYILFQGDLLVSFDIIFPDDLTTTVKDLLRDVLPN